MLNRRGFSVERLAYSKKKEIFSSCLSVKKGLTLVELFIAITLVGMVLLSITAVDIASRKFLNTTYYESRVQNEVGPILEMITKDITRGYGNVNNPGVIVPAANIVEIRQLDPAAAPTYDDFSDDTWVRYTFNGDPAYNITRGDCNSSGVSQCDSWSGSTETIANNIFDCRFTIAPDASLNKNLWVTIAITARRDARIAVDTNNNPEVILQTTIAALSQSIH